jgi:hypothetical protein
MSVEKPLNSISNWFNFNIASPRKDNFDLHSFAQEYYSSMEIIDMRHSLDRDLLRPRSGTGQQPYI